MDLNMQNNDNNKIELPANHRRAFSSTLFLIEKMLNEIEELFAPNRENMVEIKQDISSEEKENIRKAIREIKTELARLTERYELNKHQLTESYFVNSRRTKIWELLHDSSVKRMNAYGAFPEEFQSGYQLDIDQLIKLVNTL